MHRIRPHQFFSGIGLLSRKVGDQFYDFGYGVLDISSVEFFIFFAFGLGLVGCDFLDFADSLDVLLEVKLCKSDYFHEAVFGTTELFSGALIMRGKIAEDEGDSDEDSGVLLVQLHGVQEHGGVLGLHHLFGAVEVDGDLGEQSRHVQDQFLVALEASVAVDLAELGQHLAVDEQAVGVLDVGEVAQRARNLHEDHRLLVLVGPEHKSAGERLG